MGAPHLVSEMWVCGCRESIEGWWEARLSDEASWHGGMVHPEIRIGDGTARTSVVVPPTSQKRDVGHPAKNDVFYQAESIFASGGRSAIAASKK